MRTLAVTVGLTDVNALTIVYHPALDCFLLVKDDTNTIWSWHRDEVNIKRFAGSDEFGFADGPCLSAKFQCPFFLAVSQIDGSVFVADQTRIRRIHNNTVTTIAGNGKRLFSSDGAGASFADAAAIAVAKNGCVLVSDVRATAIRCLTPQTDGTYSMTTIIGDVFAFPLHCFQQQLYFNTGFDVSKFDVTTKQKVVLWREDAPQNFHMRQLLVLPDGSILFVIVASRFPDCPQIIHLQPHLDRATHFDLVYIQPLRVNYRHLDGWCLDPKTRRILLCDHKNRCIRIIGQANKNHDEPQALPRDWFLPVSHLHNWKRLAIVLAFLRANATHSFRYSILPLVPLVTQLLE